MIGNGRQDHIAEKVARKWRRPQDPNVPVFSDVQGAEDNRGISFLTSRIAGYVRRKLIGAEQRTRGRGGGVAGEEAGGPGGATDQSRGDRGK